MKYETMIVKRVWVPIENATVPYNIRIVIMISLITTVYVLKRWSTLKFT